MTSITHESAFISVPIAILALASALSLVVGPVTIEPPTSIVAAAEDNLATAVLEAIFKSSGVDISSEGAQRAHSLHLALHEHALIDVTILELKTAFTVEVSCNV